MIKNNPPNPHNLSQCVGYHAKFRAVSLRFFGPWQNAAPISRPCCRGASRRRGRANQSRPHFSRSTRNGWRRLKNPFRIDESNNNVNIQNQWNNSPYLLYSNSNFEKRWLVTMLMILTFAWCRGRKSLKPRSPNRTKIYFIFGLLRYGMRVFEDL